MGIKQVLFGKKMWIYRVSVLSIFIVSCSSPSETSTTNVLSESDSLAILSEIFESIDREAQEYEASQEIYNDGCMVSISLRNRLKIQVNCQGQVMIGNDIENTDIRQSIIDFFDKEQIDSDKYNKARFMRFNDGYLDSIIVEIERYIKELREDKNKEYNAYIEFKTEELNRYKQFRTFKKVLMLDELLIPTVYSHVQTSSGLNCDFPDTLFQQVIEAFYLMRDAESKKIFAQSYANLFSRAMHHSDALAQKKLELVSVLIPVQLKRKEEIDMVPPPPPVFD